MTREVLPVLAPIEAYEAQAAELLRALRAGDEEAQDVFRRHHPRFLDPVVTWKPRALAEGELAGAALDDDAARLAVARRHSFRDWGALAALVTAVHDEASPVRAFELAVEAVVDGDVDALERLLAAEPALVRARSTRVTRWDPPVHRATLLHYLAANGVEVHRQRSPANAVDVARCLLAAGAEPDALASMYGGEHATLAMLVSSTPPADAGVQVALIHVLVDGGARVDGADVRTALASGFRDAAEALVQRGAPVETLAVAAGLGRAEDVERLVTAAAPDERQAALALAAQHGHAALVARLLDAGADPDRFNPEGLHAHSTPLHQAALAGHVEVVRVLIDRRARLDVRDRLWDGTPLGWARHAGRDDVVRLLAVAG